MQLLNTIEVYHKDQRKSIELYYGDITQMPTEQGLDILVISSFPNSYEPTPKSLIGALHRKGIDVAKLAAEKEEDLRENYNCWLSRPIENEHAGFDRLLCWEPSTEGENPQEVVSNVFQAILPFVNREDVESANLAMPLLATGLQANQPIGMLEALLDAAVYWMSKGLPIDQLKIIEIDQLKSKLLEGAFAVLKQKYVKFARPQREFRYDVFISYSHKNKDKVFKLKELMLKADPYLEIFLDTKDLHTGSAWQQELYDALENSKKVLTLYTPGYIESKVCNEEFNIAMFRHRESDTGVLVPVYFETCNLPTYMKLIQYMDVRQLFETKPELVAKTIVEALA